MGLTPPAKHQTLVDKVVAIAEAGLQEAYAIRQKQSRSEKLAALHAQVLKTWSKRRQSRRTTTWCAPSSAIWKPRSSAVRSRTASPASMDVIRGRFGQYPFGPACSRGLTAPPLFTRGETQALAVATLGTARDEQIIDALQGEYTERFMLHYNMPPYATGETGRVGTPKRREVGHGRLAKRALVGVLPTAEEFGYSMRVVSEVTESNGSSSMASVCGGCLALMDAGVPMKAHVAGIAMGLIKEGNRFAVLTDILGDEDHLGDMDFKVAGTERGITALQMDIKIQGITKEIMQVALNQAREGRMHILSSMKQALDSPRPEISAYAPRMIVIKIKPEKIRDVIGKGGAVIRAITEETGTTIDIAEDGTVTIACVSSDGGLAAKSASRKSRLRSRLAGCTREPC